MGEGTLGGGGAPSPHSIYLRPARENLLEMRTPPPPPAANRVRNQNQRCLSAGLLIFYGLCSTKEDRAPHWDGGPAGVILAN